jgi:hypothetical protein
MSQNELEFSTTTNGQPAAAPKTLQWDWAPSELDTYVTDVARKIEAIAPERELQYDLRGEIELGRHYGYPECCINWFVEVWLPFVDTWLRFAHELSDDWKRRYISHRVLHHVSGLDQVPCPRCLRGALVGSTLTANDVQRAVDTEQKRLGDWVRECKLQSRQKAQRRDRRRGVRKLRPT